MIDAPKCLVCERQMIGDLIDVTMRSDERRYVIGWRCEFEGRHEWEKASNDDK